MTSEMGEMFKDWKEHKQTKKAQNKKSTIQILMNEGIEFEVKNGGSHLVVQGQYYTIDFWPSTGKFIPRHTDIKGRGIFNLLKHCEKKANE